MNTKIEKLVHKMMITSTGIAMLDSGGDDGRMWQRNQKQYPTVEDIKKEPEVDIDIEGFTDSKDLTPTVNVFHYLTNTLELDGLCDDFNKLPCKDWDSEKAYGISEKQAQWLEAHGLTIKDTWNSYNYESNLSQVLQGANVSREGDALEYPQYVLLQLHNGADVRGGYTDAKLFKVACEYFSTNPDVYGSIDGLDVSTSYNGYDLVDDSGNPVPVKEGSIISLSVSY
jgi:hypothetical protein